MYRSRLIKIPFISDSYTLNGTLHMPDCQHPPVVVGSHGLASNGDSPKQIELAEACNQYGIAYFRFDHRGCGKSDGIFQEVTSLENRRTDLIRAVETIIGREDTGNRLALFGSSMGGTTCIAASDVLQPEAYVLVAAPVFGNTLTKAPQRQEDEPDLPDDFYERFLKFDVSERLSDITDILVFHGDKDDIVPISNGHTIHDRAGDPKQLIIQKNGDHRMSDPVDQKNFIKAASEWYRTRLS